MNAEQRAALRKLAEEATPGPWWSGECRLSDGPALAWLGQSFVDCDGGRKNYVAPRRDADYIAATNPSTILQLLDYIETLESESAAYASNLRGKHSVAGATYATMQARIETLEKDAGRYRHLRDRNGGSLVVVQIIGVGEDDQVVLTEGDADAAIDAAMQGKK